eukprot:3278764-Prorocentrum_lima.AAC.1
MRLEEVFRQTAIRGPTNCRLRQQASPGAHTGAASSAHVDGDVLPRHSAHQHRHGVQCGSCGEQRGA